MKKVFLMGMGFIVGLGLFVSVKADMRSLPEIFSPIYGKMTAACIRKQIATTNANISTPDMEKNTMYLISCVDDTTGAGVACACVQGTSAASVSKATAHILQAGHEYPIFTDTTNLRVSCQSYAGTPYVYLCPFVP